MRHLLKFLRWGISAIFVVVIYYLAVFILPFPWRTLNVPFVYISLSILFRERGSIVWLAFILHWFIEVSTTTLFGIILFSGTTATIWAYWIYQFFLTNRSWYTAFVLSAIIVILYRALTMFLTLLTSAILDTSIPSWQLLFTHYGIEVFLTSAVSGFIYIVWYVFSVHRSR